MKLSDQHIAEATRRQQILEKVAELPAGTSLNQAARVLGEDVASLSRWRRAYAEKGFEGLIPKFHRCGRHSVAETMSPEEITAAKKLYAQTESKTTSLRMLAVSDVCSDSIRDFILKPRKSKHSLPRTMREAIDVSPAAMAYVKSPRNTALNYFFNPRDLTYLDAEGKRQQLAPGDVSDRDDMTVNFGWWTPWPWGGDKCSDRFGVRLLRGQLLPRIDVASLKFLTFTLLARQKDSYRADDIWAWIGRDYADVGLPRIGERLERGIWEGKAISGVPLDEGHTSLDRRLGGLSALGVKIIRSYKPTTKIIENRFNFLQTCMATIHGQLGRERGEMERQNKLWSACREGRRDPREFFLSMDEAVKRIEAVFHFVNNEPVEGEIYRGVPDKLWAEGLAAAPLRRLGPTERWLFARERRVVTVNKAHARVRLTGPNGPFSFWFTDVELIRREGKQVVVYFDPLIPDLPATITDLDNQVIAITACVDAVPQFACADGFDERDGFNRRKAFANAVRAEYRALGLGGLRLRGASEVNDGRGRVMSVETGEPFVSISRAGDDAPSEVNANRVTDPFKDRTGAASPLLPRRATRPAYDSEEAKERIARNEALLREQGNLT